MFNNKLKVREALGRMKDKVKTTVSNGRASMKRAQAPGQLKKVAGVQSARSFAHNKPTVDVQGAVDKAKLFEGTQSRPASNGRPAVTKITEDNPLWDPKTMGNKQGQRNAIRQYGDKGYKPSTGKGVGY